MNDKFDELTKNLAQSLTRRSAVKTLGLGLAGIALATLGLVSKAEADPRRGFKCHCNKPDYGCIAQPDYSNCYATCSSRCQPY